MRRFGIMVAIVSVLLAISLSGCSLVVDFDRRLLLDSGVDGGVDPDAGFDPSAEPTADTTVDAAPDPVADASEDDR